MANPARILGVLYATMERLVSDEMSRILAEFELSETQYRALRFLRHVGRGELAGLARALGVSAPAATRMADRLQHRGWVTRQNVDEDKRKTRLVLTEQAELALARLDKQAGQVFSQVYSQLGLTEQQQLLSGVAAFLQAGLEQIPVGRPCLYCGQLHVPDCPLLITSKKRPPVD